MDWTIVEEIWKPTLEEAKGYCKVRHDLEDDLINSLISAAVSKCTSFCRHFVFRTQAVCTVKSDTLAIDGVQMVIDKVEIKRPLESTFTELAEADYEVETINGLTAVLTLTETALYETGTFIKVTMTSGTLADTPESEKIKVAALMMVSNWYNNRDDKVKQMPSTSENLLISYKVYTIK